MVDFADIFVRLIIFATRPWFWFYENFIAPQYETYSVYDEDELAYLEEQLGWTDKPDDAPDRWHHIIIEGKHYAFETVEAAKKFMKEYKK